MSERVAPAAAGVVKREPAVLELTALGPWSGRVAVTPVRGLARARADAAAARNDVSFEVRCEWTGPPLPGLPPVDSAVAAEAVHYTEELELAKAVAVAAADELRAAKPPELHRLVARFG